MERINEDLYTTVRHASEVHRQVRRWAQSWIKPGIKLIDMCEKIEQKNRELVQESGLSAGIGFPTGCSINHVAAHYTPNCGDNTTLQEGDVMSIDFGTQIDGRIIDCAWTLCFQDQFLPLLEATREATNTGIRACGIDVPLNEVGELIQETMESYEVSRLPACLPACLPGIFLLHTMLRAHLTFACSPAGHNRWHNVPRQKCSQPYGP